MLTLFQTGHRSRCPALSHSGKCNCERSQYIFTGTLALVVALIQAFFGYDHSAALLTDSLHAFADSLADFLGAYIVWRIILRPHKEEEYRSRGEKIIATLLFLGAAWIAFETMSRVVTGHMVTPSIAMTIGFASAVIDGFRWQYLQRAQNVSWTRTRGNLILHAKTDCYHGIIVGGIGFAAWIAELFSSSSPEVVSIILFADLALSFRLVEYMIKLSINIWKGRGCGHNHDDTHTHDHYDHH